MKQCSNVTMKKGFSFIELLVIITIIGILIGVLVVVAGPARKQVKEARISNDLVELQNIAENLYLENGSYANVNCGQVEIATLCSDVQRQGSSAQIFKTGDFYCAYAVLDSSTTKSFCVDSLGFTDELYFPTLSCASRRFCDYRSCPDFNDNNVVDVVDIDCIKRCYLTNQNGAVDTCGTDIPGNGGIPNCPDINGDNICDCARCDDIDPDGPGPFLPDGNRGPECLQVYDGNRDGAIDVVNDILQVTLEYGTPCS